MIEDKELHSGQYKPYGDSYYIWAIKTDEKDEDKLMAQCKTRFGKEHATTVKSVEHWWSNDLRVYFSGCCSLKKIEETPYSDMKKDGYDYVFTYLYPWDD